MPSRVGRSALCARQRCASTRHRTQHAAPTAAVSHWKGVTTVEYCGASGTQATHPLLLRDVSPPWPSVLHVAASNLELPDELFDLLPASESNAIRALCPRAFNPSITTAPPLAHCPECAYLLSLRVSTHDHQCDGPLDLTRTHGKRRRGRQFAATAVVALDRELQPLASTWLLNAIESQLGANGEMMPERHRVHDVRLFRIGDALFATWHCHRCQMVIAQVYIHAGLPQRHGAHSRVRLYAWSTLWDKYKLSGRGVQGRNQALILAPSASAATPASLKVADGRSRARSRGGHWARRSHRSAPTFDVALQPWLSDVVRLRPVGFRRISVPNPFMSVEARLDARNNSITLHDAKLVAPPRPRGMSRLSLLKASMPLRLNGSGAGPDPLAGWHHPIAERLAEFLLARPWQLDVTAHTVLNAEADSPGSTSSQRPLVGNATARREHAEIARSLARREFVEGSQLSQPSPTAHTVQIHRAEGRPSSPGTAPFFTVDPPNGPPRRSADGARSGRCVALLGIGHVHASPRGPLPSARGGSAVGLSQPAPSRASGWRWGTNYSHFFYTLDPRPPHHMLAASGLFCLAASTMTGDHPRESARTTASEHRTHRPAGELIMHVDAAASGTSAHATCESIQFVSGLALAHGAPVSEPVKESAAGTNATDTSAYRLLLTYGINDCSAALGWIPLTRVWQMLAPLANRSAPCTDDLT